MSNNHYCPKDRMRLNFRSSGGISMNLVCDSCGFSKKFEPKTAEEALVLETHFRSGSSASGASSGITVNAFTKMDPTLPHVNTIRCPNGGCPSNTGAVEKDVIYMKIDPANLKFQYVCTHCPSQWTN
jgi:hypothetical protein